MATATSAWAKPGAWALESEEHAAMEKDNLSSAFPSLTPATSDPSADFPSLATAAASKSSKKKKPQVLSLAEFSGGKPVSHGAAARSRPADALSSSSSKGLTADELSLLPTGPRERSAEELERSSRGFGYSTYSNGGARRVDGSVSRVSGDESRRNPLNRDSGPSRADEVDDWGSMKRSVGPPPERRERGGGFFDSQSRADEVDSWVSKRSSASPADGLREKRGGFEIFGKERSAVGGAESDSWGRKKEEVIRADSDTWGRKRDGVSKADSDAWGRKREEVNGTGGGRPRLVLQPRSLPLVNGNTDSNGEANHGENPVVNSKGSNPFGLARPREEVLAEKGQDWKKLDEKLDSIKIREGVTDGLPLGKKGLNLGNGSLSEDRTERSWRKEVASDAVASLKEDQTEASLLDN
ncbi:hypothetical protein M5K25_009590 [Dendrobium thyrsiflorum]|uniref:Eukaryotic translation initiation factor 4B3-like n=1 Tax=Dendrobium thyrsiflorum TaxID=117978 RepID=A0ABD0VD68_DENTH